MDAMMAPPAAVPEGKAPRGQYDGGPFARRLVPARGDIAARCLKGQVAARRYADPRVTLVAAPLLDLTLEPDPQAERATQLLRGEVFHVYAEEGGLAWGQAATDGYVGYVAAAGLAPVRRVDAVVFALSSHLYPAPDIKQRPLMALPFLASLAAAGPAADGFVPIDGGGFVPAAHLAAAPGDAVAQAERFLGTPYLWGGRSAAGIDCSALVQLALAAAGSEAPRDSDMQAALLGEPVPEDAPLLRGDLVFWKGHVGLMMDVGTLVHANAHHMAVAREPLALAAARIAAAGGGSITARRRAGSGGWSWPRPEVG
jgi:cell wall-associated NlpC family hydrolase